MNKKTFSQEDLQEAARQIYSKVLINLSYDIHGKLLCLIYSKVDNKLDLIRSLCCSINEK